MTVNGRRHTNRGDAGKALLHVLVEAHQGTLRGRDTNGAIGALGGFDLHIEATRRIEDIVLSLDGIPTARTHVDVDAFARDNPGHSLVRRLEGHLNRIDTLLDQRRNAEHEHRTRADQTRSLLGTPFDRAAELAAAKQQLAEVEKEIAELDEPPSSPTPELPARSPAPGVPTRPRSHRPPVGLATARPRDATRAPPRQPVGRDL
jgi:hypothetical protein